MSRELSPANTQSYYIMELELSNVYVCRIAARNEVGVGAFSFPVHLSTRAEMVL